MRSDGRFAGHVVRSGCGVSLGVVSVKTSMSPADAMDSSVLLAVFAGYSRGQQHRTNRLHSVHQFSSYSTTCPKSVFNCVFCLVALSTEANQYDIYLRLINNNKHGRISCRVGRVMTPENT